MSVYRESIYKIKGAKPEIFECYSKKGATSIFIYSRNVLKNGKLGYYDDENKRVRSIAKQGEILVPASFFEKYLDLKVTDSGDTVTVSRGKKTLTAKLGEARLEVSGKAHELSYPIPELEGHKYLPALKVAEDLGLTGRSYDGGKLLVFGDVKLLDEIERDVDLEVSATYATIGKYDVSKFTKADFDAVKDKWREVLVGSEKMNDTTDPDFREKLDEISRATKTAWDTLHKEKDRFILWGDAPPTLSSDLTRQYVNVWALARGYATYGTEYYQNEELGNTVLDCLLWMYENMYGEKEIEERGWRSMLLFNWWDWFVGGVEPLTDTLFVMEKHLTQKQISDYLKAFRHVITLHRHGESAAMSRLKVCTKAALLLEDREMLDKACIDYDLTLSVTREDKGVHVDYVDWTHNIPYNMMYGFNNLSRTCFVGTLLGGTPLEFVSPKQYELFNVAKYMFEAACYKGQGFVAFNGRATAGREFSSGVAIMLGVLPIIGLFGEAEDAHLKRLVKRCASTPELVKMLKSQCSVYNFAKLMEILRDDTIPTENDYELCHAWFTGDRIAQHRDDRAILIAMTSERHPSYESINSANKRGWYTCDGSVYYYNNTDRHAYDGVNFIMNPDVCQRIPGTTVDVRPRQPWSYSCLKGWKSPRDFAGVIDVDKQYGFAAFEYESYHYEGHENDGTSDGNGGGGLTFWENDLVAKKSYFLFDRECVCLGAGINSTMNSEVVTTIEHRRLVKDSSTAGTEDIYIDGELLSKDNYEREFTDPAWAHLEGFSGYVLPNGGKIKARKYTYVPDLSLKDNYFRDDPEAEIYKEGKPFFELGFTHGENPKDATYEYVMLPNATKDETAAYSISPEVEIISNTAELQAVMKPALGLTFIAFYKAGSCSGISVSHPCLASLFRRDGTLELSLADPTRKLGSVTVTLDGEYIATELPIRVAAKVQSGHTVLTLDLHDTTGEAVRVKLKKRS